jgi:cytochrome c-type biogenesis protein
VGLLGILGEAFLLGLATPLGAVCVLPIYPGFLVYLSTQVSAEKTSRTTIFLFGLIITSGVILFMFLMGLLFTTVLEVSLTSIVEIISPIAFGILLIMSLILIITGIRSVRTGVDIDICSLVQL